jgi:MoxR-like ATPase
VFKARCLDANSNQLFGLFRMMLDFAALSTVLPVVAGSRHPVLIRGKHGIGKSESVYAFARAIGLPVIERRASQMTEGDLLGLPDQNGVTVGGQRATAYNPPAWLVQACTEPVVLFVDEIDRGTTEVRQGFFELTDSRKIAGFTLHDGTIIVAAVNGGPSAAEYTVADMDPAELDRYTTFDVAPTVEDWVTWASGRTDATTAVVSYNSVAAGYKAHKSAVAAGKTTPIADVIVDFIRHNPTHLEHSDTFEPGKVYPSRRSWSRFSDAASAAGLLADCKASRAMLARLSAGYVGMEASIAFVDFAVNYERQVTVDDIIVHGKIARVADFGVVEHTALVDKIATSGIFDRELSASEIQNLANYFVRLPSEVAMVLFSAIPKGSAGPVNIGRFYNVKADNGVVVSARVTEVL